MSNLPYEVFTTDEVKIIESEHAKVSNGHCFDLMQKAGRSVFDYIVRVCGDAKEVWVFCGKGNNGGDGYIVATLLLDNGIKHRVFATGIPHEGSEASIAYEYYVKLGGVIEYELPNNGLPPDPNNCIISYQAPDVIIDALLGTGIDQAPTGISAKWISYINKLNSYVVSVDVPSGVCADTGLVPGLSVRANATVCMLALKPGLLTSDAVNFVGHIEFASLGLDVKPYHELLAQNSYKSLLPIYQICFDDVIDELPKRLASYNKSDSGKVLLIAGSKGMGGACIICGQGALRTGSGLVKVAMDPINIPAMLARCPELMSIDYSDEDLVTKAILWSDAIAIGPGLGVNEKTARFMSMLSDLEDQTLVYDADALNVLATYEQDYYKENRILTPHPGEAARLLGIEVEEVNDDRLKACYKLQQKYGGVVLLKGAGTIVCDGKKIVIINEGSPALATGGSGDLLTGIIVALLGQGLELSKAAIVGAALHGRAGFLAGENEGILGSLPTDLFKYIRELINAKR